MFMGGGVRDEKVQGGLVVCVWRSSEGRRILRTDW